VLFLAGFDGFNLQTAHQQRDFELAIISA